MEMVLFVSVCDYNVVLSQRQYKEKKIIFIVLCRKTRPTWSKGANLKPVWNCQRVLQPIRNSQVMFPEWLATSTVRDPDHAQPIKDKHEMSTVNRSECLAAEKYMSFSLLLNK